VAALLSGCWDRREPNEVAHVLAVGFDIDDEGSYEIMAQFVDPMAARGGTAVGGGPSVLGPAFWVYSAKGHTPFDAARNLHPIVSREVQLTNVEVILISERLARAGIMPLLDFIQRDPNLRLAANLAVVEGAVEKVLGAVFPGTPIPALALDQLLSPTHFTEPAVMAKDMLGDLVEFLRPGQDLALPRLKVHETGQEASSEGQEGGSKQGSSHGQGASVESSMKPPVMYIGGAAFKGDKMVGWLEGREAMGLNMVAGERQRASIVVKSPAGEGLAALHLTRLKTTVRPRLIDDEVRIGIDVMAVGYLEDQTGLGPDRPGMDLNDPKVVESLRARFSEVIRNDIELAVARARELKADILGFGNAVYRKLPRTWNDLADRWDEVFQTVPLDITVKVTITRPGMIRNATVPRWLGRPRPDGR
jgi:spore germination protein KC